MPINSLFDSYLPKDSNPRISTPPIVKRKRNSLKSIGKNEAEKRIHNKIESDRRKRAKMLSEELRSLMNHWRPSHCQNLSQNNLLTVANNQIDQINSKYQSNPPDPSNLTQDEKHFLDIESSNGFLFVTTIESSGIFPIIYVNESIKHVLGLTAEQWLNNDLCSFIHPDDLGHVRTQLNSLNTTIRIQCGIRTQTGAYSMVIIDGMIKILNHSLQPVSNNQLGSPAFVGVCQLPLSIKYNQINQYYYQKSSSFVFHCRCYPERWSIFLIDRAVSTICNISFNYFEGKSILDFIPIEEQKTVEEFLTNASTLMINHTIQCHFINPIDRMMILMTLQIKPLLNPKTQQTDFIDLHFENEPTNNLHHI